MNENCSDRRRGRQNCSASTRHCLLMVVHPRLKPGVKHSSAPTAHQSQASFSPFRLKTDQSRKVFPCRKKPNSRRAESPPHGRKTSAPRAPGCSTAQLSMGDRHAPLRRGGRRRAGPMWRPPGANPSCFQTPGCGALRAPHPGLCMVRPFGPNLADQSDGLRLGDQKGRRDNECQMVCGWAIKKAAGTTSVNG
ncbi:hypothetical protein J3R75_003425 [Oligosphaera ethanolica]|uniref:Uncharacterized protein n=1 Tax=Oligosphaera ethanolica TaxID=760260 RepID=A0AAE3VJ04_9BACT|nr:hypothetical protein [Oligosphaera ethanolica]